MNPQQMQQPQMMMPGQQAYPQMQQGGQQAGAPQMVMPGQQGANAAAIGSMAMQQVQNTNVAASRRDDPSSTQATLLISELRDNMVIMKDGSFRAVVACKSINFDLMSDTEREGVE